LSRLIFLLKLFFLFHLTIYGSWLIMALLLIILTRLWNFVNRLYLKDFWRIYEA
jgi:hypothetical protein